MAQQTTGWITWLETHWVAPAYAGGVLLGLTLAFFAAGVNTLSGWLYAISGLMLAISLISFWWAPRTFHGIQVYRRPSHPVSVGETLTVTLTLDNPTTHPKRLLQVRDHLPAPLGPPPEIAIAALPPRTSQQWTYLCQPQRRGLYTWDTVALRTAAPLGLFWCQRPRRAPAQATVYPQILPLQRCPLIDRLGMAGGLRWQATRQSHAANEGLTRALRPYRWGDPTRLIHWRTSARYGELRVRELEELTADNQVLIALDTGDRWTEASFESAVTAAASLYLYGLRRHLSVGLWLAHAGILQRQHSVLSALAAVTPGRQNPQDRLPPRPVIWLSPAAQMPQALPPGSLWVQWLPDTEPRSPLPPRPSALSIHPSQSLQEQLQSEITLP